MTDDRRPDELDEEPEDDTGNLPAPRQTTPLDQLVRANRELWEPLIGESRQAFHWYSIYRDYGPTRSIAKVAEDHGRGLAQLYEWSRHWRWQERNDAYDLDVDRRRRAENETIVDQARRRYQAGGALLYAEVMEELRRRREAEGNALATEDFSDLVRALQTAQKVELTALGEATEIVKGAAMVPVANVTTIARALIEAALEIFPDEHGRHDLYMLRVNEIGRTGR